MRPITFFKLILTVSICVFLSGCAIIFQKQAGTLKLEEHQLSGAPELVPLSFIPLEGNQAEVLAKHSSERALSITNEAVMVEGNPALSALGESTDLQAVVRPTSQGKPDQTVELLRGSEVIFQAPAGLPSPAVPVQALWTYDKHWALEILYSDESTWAGKIYIDGVLINDQKGYDDAFGLQLLAGKPFYFFSRDGQVGYSYNGKETDLGYDEIPHYRCCGESEINPKPGQNMVAFFANKANTWYYVELGIFK
jgi:hypothetical protein